MPKSATLDNVGLILIGHGSKLPHNQENLEKIAQIMREHSSFKVVEISFMMRNKPTIQEAIDNIAKKGVTKIVLVPAFLAPGVHTTQEIPQLIEVKDKESQLSKRGIERIWRADRRRRMHRSYLRRESTQSARRRLGTPPCTLQGKRRCKHACRFHEDLR